VATTVVHTASSIGGIHWRETVYAAISLLDEVVERGASDELRVAVSAIGARCRRDMGTMRTRHTF
jgi:hypothetical protein